MTHRSKARRSPIDVLFVLALVAGPESTRALAQPGGETPAAATPASPVAPSRAAADTSLASLRTALLEHPADAARARTYRQGARRAGQLDSAIADLRAALGREPSAQGVRFELALALVDRVSAPPTPDLPAQSRLASQATRLLTEILAVEPEQWTARYARGMTHLLFPLPTKHYEPAAEDFLKLVEVQRPLPQQPHFARTFVALGDAYVLDLQLTIARSWWEIGRKLFPEDPELEERLGIALTDLESAIVPRYGFEHPFDTDLDYLWVP